MAEYEREFRWYLIGCDRLGHTPLDAAEFTARWLELESHAERLKQADKEKTLSELEVGKRAEMQRRIKDDPFVKAVLVGMAEETQSR
jgi:hypothetical protein